MSDPIAHAYLSAAGRAELPALTGLRAVAAAWVTAWHASDLTAGPRFPFNHGYLGVDLFFILSGFIIAYVYWRDFAQFSPRLYARFIALRLARLWPAHVAILALFTALMLRTYWRAGWPVPQDLEWEVVAQLLLVHNWGVVHTPITINLPAWSISAEFLAYLLFPLYVLVFARLRSTRALLFSIPLAVLVCGLLITVLLRWHLVDTGPVANIRVVCEFAVGVALFRLWERVRLSSLLATFIACGALALIFLIAALTPPRHGLDYVIVLLLAPLIFAIAQGGLLARLLSSRIAVYLGEISYSTYLGHALVIGIVEAVLRRLGDSVPRSGYAGWSLLLLTIAFSFAAGALLFHVVEKPMRLWLRRRIDRHMPVLKTAAA